MVASGASVHIQDTITGNVLVHSFNIQDPVCGAAYFQKLNQLAVVTGPVPGALLPLSTFREVHFLLRAGFNDRYPVSLSLKPPKSSCAV